MTRLTDFLKKHEYIPLVLIVFVQVLLIVFWGFHKENLYWDEYYTLEEAHYISASTGGTHYITEDSAYSKNTWLSTDFVRESITVNRDNSMLKDPVKRTLSRMVKSKNYTVLLNILTALFSPGKVSVWPAIIINVIVFAINQLLLFAIVRDVSGEALPAWLVVAFYGFSGMCISMAIFVRFYMWATLAVTLFVYGHLKYYSCAKDQYLKRFLLFILSYLSLYIGLQNVPFMVFFCAFFAAVFVIVMIKREGFKSAAIYSTPALIGGIYVLISSGYLKALTDPVGFYMSTGGNGAWGWFMGQILGFRLSMLPRRLVDIARLIGDFVLGGKWIMMFVGIFCVLMLVFLIVKRKLKDQFSELFKDGFFLVLFFSVLLFMGMFTVFKLYEQMRYISFAVPELCIVIVLVLGRLMPTKRTACVALLSLVVVQAIGTSVGEKIDMLYRGDREQIKAIKDTGIDSFMLDNGAFQPFITYQTALLSDEGDEFYVYDSMLPVDEGDFRDEMLVVIEGYINDTDTKRALDERGYTLTYVGSTYYFDVFKAER